MTITEWLLEQIAADEELATEVRPHEHLTSRDSSELTRGDDRGYATVAATSGRVLAECQAKRRIVELHEHDGYPIDDIPGMDYSRCVTCVDSGPDAQGWPCATLKLLALPYVDRPGYDEDWRP